jgi:O-antigen/teichoic acid export membrane protein
MIARKSFLIVSSQFFARFLGWIGLFILAKLWGSHAPEALGYIGFAMAFLTLFHLVAKFGFLEAHVKRISEGKDLGTCIGTYASIKILFTGVMILSVVAAISLLQLLFHERFLDEASKSIIYIFLIYHIFLNLKEIPMQTFSGTKEIVKRQITWTTENIIKIPLTIIVALAGISAVGISPIATWPQFLQPLQQFIADHATGSLAMTYVFGCVASFLVGMWLLRKYPIKKPSWKLSKSYLSFGIPITIISLIVIISINIDKVMIGYFCTQTEVGYYWTVQQLSEVIIILSTALGIVLFPTLSEYHATNNFKGLIKTTHQAERYISMVTIPIVVLIIIFAEPIIYFMLSSSFISAAPVLIIIAIYAFILGVMKPYSSLIAGMNKPGVAAKIGITMCTVNIALNYLFIPKGGALTSFGIDGAVGAAIATLISLIIGLFGFQLAAKKMIKMKILNSHIPRHIIAGVGMGLILFFSSELFIPSVYWYHLIGLAMIGLALYFGMLFILKEFKKQDFDFFWNMMHPKEMMKYIKSEMKEKR